MNDPDTTVLPSGKAHNERPGIKPMLKKILLFALPLALSGILQQLFTSADMAVIFRFGGTVAQSAVNSNGALVNLLINLFTGLSVGVTVVIAEHIGKKRTADLHSVALTCMVMAVVSGVFLLGLGIGLSEPLLRLMKTPSDALPLAITYLRVYFIGMPFLMVFNFGAAALRGAGDTQKALIILIVTGFLNLGLNILFVAACKMSVAGVATATVVANLVSALMVLFFLMRDERFRMRKGGSRVRMEYVKRIIVIGLPAGLQGVVFSISNVLIQSAINTFGAQAVAGSGDALNFEYYVYFFVNAFAQVAVTFVGQEYAAGNYAMCRRIFNIAMTTALVVSTVLSVGFTVGGRLFIRIYTTDEAAIEYAVMRMRCVLLGSMLNCLYEIPGGAMRGMGHSFLPALFTIIGSCILRIVWIYTAYAATGQYWMLLIVYPISWVATGAAMIISYYVICYKAGFYSKHKAAPANCSRPPETVPLASDNAEQAEVAATANDTIAVPTETDTPDF